MEWIPKIELRDDTLVVIDRVERHKAHEKPRQWHPTSLILVLDADGLVVTVDKYPKNLRKAEVYGYTPPAPSCRPDAMGGHIQYDQLTEAELQRGLTAETFRRGALCELSEEILVDGQPLTPDPERLKFHGVIRIEEEAEFAGVFSYRIEGNHTYTGYDDLALPAGGREQLLLPTMRFSPEELLALYQKTKTGATVLAENGLPYRFSTGLAAILEQPEWETWVR